MSTFAKTNAFLEKMYGEIAAAIADCDYRSTGAHWGLGMDMGFSVDSSYLYWMWPRPFNTKIYSTAKWPIHISG